MEDIRYCMRLGVSEHREQNRQAFFNELRDIPTFENVLTKNDVLKLATDLRTKSKTSSDLLSTLKMCFVQNKENIKTFLKVDGVLHCLVRELTGKNSANQLESAYCLCNLAMGDAKVSNRIIKAAGPYLISHLNGMNIYLVEACCWTLGNLSNHSEKCCSALKSQGMFEEVVKLLSADEDVVISSAIYALSRFIYFGHSLLNELEIHAITTSAIPVYKKHPQSSAFLISLISGSVFSHCCSLNENIHLLLLTRLSQLLQDGVDNDKLPEITSSIRIIGNLISSMTDQQTSEFLCFPEPNRCLFPIICSAVLESEEVFLKKELIWVLGNVLNFSSFGVNFIQNLSSHSQLEISKLLNESKK